MTIVTWRNTALVLAVVCAVQRWQGCTRSEVPVEPRSELRHADPPATRGAAAFPGPSLDAPSSGGGKRFHGFQIPAWALRLLPQPGETLRAYRDRILPLAQIAIASQRARVARTRDELTSLDSRQRAELDAAVAEAATAIRDRVISALASGELRPATLKPMTGVAIARDVLDIVERGNTRFENSLTPDQRTGLAAQRFDFADYLLFTARWEDALHAPD
ncbi:MAG TPA: hypothetical protein VFT22_36580 [Kofleriaceae bacterium]|nr:hypothetical protein [Kofleriaceae bacterium]